MQPALEVVTDHRIAFVRKLHREALRSLSAVSTDSTPKKLLLLGGGSLLPGVDEALSESFGLPAERLNILEFIEHKDAGADPAFSGAVLAPAVGAAHCSHTGEPSASSRPRIAITGK